MSGIICIILQKCLFQACNKSYVVVKLIIIDFHRIFPYVFFTLNFFCFFFPQISVTRTKQMFVTQRQRISESSVDTAQLPTLPLLPCNLPPPYLDLDSDESAAEDQNSLTSNEEWDSGAAATKPRAGSKKSKAQGSKQGQSSHESTYKRRSSWVRTQIRGHNPRGTILHL